MRVSDAMAFFATKEAWVGHHPRTRRPAAEHMFARKRRLRVSFQKDAPSYCRSSLRCLFLSLPVFALILVWTQVLCSDGNYRQPVELLLALHLERKSTVLDDEVHPLHKSLYPWEEQQIHRGERQQTEKDPNVVVFYDAFVSSDDLGLAAIDLRSVQAQLKQIAESYAALFTGNVVLYYNTIGVALSPDYLRYFCRKQNSNLTCEHMEHYNDEMGSSATSNYALTALRDFCREDDSKTVVYLHSKSMLSFHSITTSSTEQNHNWQRSLTAAATSRACLESLAAPIESGNPQCNVCGLNFHPLPELHFPGNMWIAQCSYVKQLLSPETFRDRKAVIDSMVREHRTMRDEHSPKGIFSAGLSSSHSTVTYEYENWVASHPDFRPCDVSPTVNLTNWWLDQRNDYDAEFELANAPRHSIGEPWTWYPYTTRLQTEELQSILKDANRTARMVEYGLLRGLIVRWHILYDRFPVYDSWVWSWFPDGDLWRMGVARYGADATNILVRALSTDD